MRIVKKKIHRRYLMIEAVPKLFHGMSFLTAIWMSGFHMLEKHAEYAFTIDAVDSHKASDCSAVVFRDGHRANAQHINWPLVETFSEFRATVEDIFKIQNSDKSQPESQQQPWAAFNSEGGRLDNMDHILSSLPLLIIFEGGQWVWPGIEIGFKRKLSNLNLENVPEMITLSLHPAIFEIHDFFTDEECDHIIERSKKHIKRSSVSHMDHDKGKPDALWRTSSTYFLPTGSDQSLQSIDGRISDLTHVPKSHQEYLQVLNYRPGEQYVAHHDYFNPEFYKDLHYLDGGYNNRLVTVFCYISDVEKGGETGFPLAGGAAYPESLSGCEDYPLKVNPERRKVSVFYNMLANGELDPLSLHAGCPVEGGEKWSANKWVWSKPRS
eukprot:267467_1